MCHIDKKIDGYIAATPFHLFALMCLLHNQNGERRDCVKHLIVLNQFKGAKQISSRLLELGLIDRITYISPYYQSGGRNAIRYLISYLFRKKSTEREFLARNPMLEDIRGCGSLYIPYPSKLVLDIKDYLCPDADIFLYDDGVGSYTGGVLKHFTFSHLSHCGVRRFLHLLINLVTGGHYYLNPKALFVFNPEFVCFDRIAPIPLHRINHLNVQFAEDAFPGLNNLGGYEAFDVVILGTSRDASEYKRAVNVLECISSHVESSLQVLYRPHPRNLEPNTYPGFTLDQKRAPWELLCLFGAITNETVLIGFGSSGLVFPKMIFDLEPTIVSLHEICSTSCSEYSELLEKIRMNYSDQTKIHIPATMKELLNILNGLLGG